MDARLPMILGPIYPPDKCYLFEVLLWRSFGRFPEASYDGDVDWRFSPDVRDGYDAPISGGAELSPSECRFAGIPDDPRMSVATGEREGSDLEHYERLIRIAEGLVPGDPKLVEDFKSKRQEAEGLHAELAAWQLIHGEYLDPYQIEICRALQRGDLRAFGTSLPDVSRDVTNALLESKGLWLDSLEVGQIARESWISSGIDWVQSSLKTRQSEFIWVHLEVSEMLRFFPPAIFLDRRQLIPLGGNFALASSVAEGNSALRGRGRPALPWDDFHVEVARMFRDQEMPTKKEAAIASLQGWFQKTMGKHVSRASIGERLKPYYDRLVRADRK